MNVPSGAVVAVTPPSVTVKPPAPPDAHVASARGSATIRHTRPAISPGVPPVVGNPLPGWIG